MKNLKIIIPLLITVAVSWLFVGCMPKDADVKANAEKVITHAGVNVEVQNGVATLTGEVPDEMSKTRTEADVKSVKGVKSVINNITVAVPPPPEPMISEDNALTTQMQSVLAKHPTVQAQTMNGVVTLTGTIEKKNLQQLMEEVNALHPKQVVNNITIK